MDATYASDLLKPFGGKMPACPLCGEMCDFEDFCPLCGEMCDFEDGPECYMDDYMPTKVVACPRCGEVSPPKLPA